MVAGGVNVVGMESNPHRPTESDSLDGEILYRHLKQSQKSCELCFEDKAIYDFIKPLSCCKYDKSCTNCLLEVINTSMQEKTIAHINCPNRQCAQAISPQDIRVLTQNCPDAYKTFCDIALHECLNKDLNIKQCPIPNCTFRFENDQKLKRAFICPECKQRYCSDCLVRHAPEMTCEEAHAHAQLIGDKTNVDKANKEWLQKNTRACPRCKASVEKNGGCHHMTCKLCKHQFCWKCLNPHDHTMNHPCGLWENDEQMNQGHNQLVNQVEQNQPNINVNANRNRAIELDARPYGYVFLYEPEEQPIVNDNMRFGLPYEINEPQEPPIINYGRLAVRFLPELQRMHGQLPHLNEVVAGENIQHGEEKLPVIQHGILPVDYENVD